MNSDVKIDQLIDTSGTRCPIPMLRTKQALRTMQSGETVQVLTTDPAAKADFDAMLKHLPHELMSFVEGDGQPKIDIFIIRKG